jgi:hypothetical protein
MSKNKTTAKNVIAMAQATGGENAPLPHEKFLGDWKVQRDRRANVRAKRKAAFITQHGAEGAAKVADSKKSTKESFEYPAIVGETPEDHAALSYCAALERAEKVTGVNLIQLLTNTFAFGVSEGGRAKGESQPLEATAS